MNSQEHEAEIASNDYDFWNRIYSSNLVRFLTIDKFSSKYPYYSPYSYAGNSPIMAIDIKGDSIYFVNAKGLFKANVDLILKMKHSSVIIKRASKSSTENIYIVQMDDGGPSGLNIPKMNAYVKDGVIFIT